MPCERKHIQDGIDALQMWLDMGDCECETATHTCGKPKIERALAGLRLALAALEQIVDVDRVDLHEAMLLNDLEDDLEIAALAAKSQRMEGAA